MAEVHSKLKEGWDKPCLGQQIQTLLTNNSTLQVPASLQCIRGLPKKISVGHLLGVGVLDNTFVQVKTYHIINGLGAILQS